MAMDIREERSINAEPMIVFGCPGMSGDVKDCVSKCDHCIKYWSAQKRKPLIPIPLPSRPWEWIAADILEFDKKHYVVMGDYYSRFNELIHLPSLTS